MPVSLTTAQVIYAAETKILELAEIIAVTSSFKKLKKEILIAEALIRYIRVLQTDDSLTADEELAITQHMINIGDLYDYPASPTITSHSIFNFSANTGPQGPQGEPGEDGGGTDYTKFSLAAGTHTLDSFAVTDADGAEWSYVITSGSNRRSGRFGAVWLSDGSDHKAYEYGGMDLGDTSPVTLSWSYASGTVSLIATVASGTWDIKGTRYFIPNNGAGTGVINTTLANGKIFIGNASSEAQAQTVSGDITISNTGVAAIASDVIVNADVKSNAAIAVSKLAAMTATRVAITDASGFLTTSSITPTKLGYLTDVTSNIQAQLDSKLGSATGAISTVVSSDLTANRALISNAAGKIAVHSTVSDTALGYIATLTSAAQAQIDSKQATITGAATTVVSSDLTASKILVSNASGKIAAGTIAEADILTTGDIDPTLTVTVPSGSPRVLTKVIDIGDWNMDTTATVIVSHGIADYKKIRGVQVVIRSDADTQYEMLTMATSAGVVAGSVTDIGATTIDLTRTTSGQFDSTGWDSTSFNRGWITITYVE